MILIIPKNRLCTGKATRFPITNYDPVLWLKTDNEDYSVITIDGFIVNAKNAVNGVFKKLEKLDEANNEKIEVTSITSVISENEILLIKQLAQVFECQFYLFVWPINFPVGYDQEQKLIQSFTFQVEGDKIEIKTRKQLTLTELENGISTLRGKSFSFVKQMNSASSNVECHLANNTTNPWPGDIDALIYSHKTKRYEIILEFKTHNIDTPIQNESIGKYGQEDWRRFNVLFDLIDNFQIRLNYRPTLIFIVWGTNEQSPNHSNIKIDILERNKVIKSTLFPRPIYNVFSPELFNHLILCANES